MPIVEQAKLFLKVLSNSRRNLAIGHLVNCFDADDALTQSFAGETFFELGLWLAGAKDQNRFGIAKLRDHLIIVSVEIADVMAILLVFPPALFRSGTAGKSCMLCNA